MEGDHHHDFREPMATGHHRHPRTQGRARYRRAGRGRRRVRRTDPHHHRHPHPDHHHRRGGAGRRRAPRRAGVEGAGLRLQGAGETLLRPRGDPDRPVRPGHTPSQDEVAKQLGTTEAGTNSAEDTTRVLNTAGGKDYHTVAIPDPAAKPEQVDRLQTDLVHAIDTNRPVVANIKGTATDVDGGTHSYEGGHYLTVVGYDDHGHKVKIADPADPNNNEYWMTSTTLANWIAERGYSA
ncbi:C39 family peptidase [Plantactinospora sp. CA-290183]|uniref:C39 family peptidase n=1 Tax=Plantactinospora sp. CA-290183 TaxID=3240006 RepID=UPI003D8D9D8B